MSDENNMSKIKSDRIDAWYGDSTDDDALKARDGQMKTSMRAKEAASLVSYEYSDGMHTAKVMNPDSYGKTPRSKARTSGARKEYHGVK